MLQAVDPKRKIRAILIASAFGLLATACGGKSFEYHEISDIVEGPGFLTGEAGEATFDPTTGEFELGNSIAIRNQGKRSAEIRRRRTRARRKLEGATGS
jgi:hypothetical protein